MIVKLFKIAFLFTLIYLPKKDSDGVQKLPVRQIKEADYKNTIDKLRLEYGRNKRLVKKIELPILIALSFYPELKNIEIQFLYSNIKTTMETRPTASTISKSKDRIYTIHIDNDIEGGGIVIEDVPFNAQIGIVAHELAHIVDYEHRSSLNIIYLGLKYSNKKTRAIFEKSIDISTIERGFGWQLYDWSDFVVNKSSAPEKYKKYKRETYLTPEEIEVEIKKNVKYKP